MAKATIFFTHKEQMTKSNIPPDTRYKVLTYSTMGWTLADDQAVNLTRAECDQWIQNLIAEGKNPAEIKAAISD